MNKEDHSKSYSGTDLMQKLLCEVQYRIMINAELKI